MVYHLSLPLSLSKTYKHVCLLFTMTECLAQKISTYLYIFVELNLKSCGIRLNNVNSWLLELCDVAYTLHLLILRLLFYWIQFCLLVGFNSQLCTQLWESLKRNSNFDCKHGQVERQCGGHSWRFPLSVRATLRHPVEFHEMSLQDAPVEEDRHIRVTYRNGSQSNIH